MNSLRFGRILTGIGALLLLIGVAVPLATMPRPLSHDAFKKGYERRAVFTTPSDALIRRQYNLHLRQVELARTDRIACIYGRFGHDYCPLGSYTALVTYTGIVLLVLGLAIVASSRRSETGQV